MSAALDISEVSVRFGNYEALRDVNVCVEPGTMLAVTGASGAGKTTLLWTAAGLLSPETGTVSYGYTNISGRDAALEHGGVLIPQGNGLATVLTAHENVVVALLAGGYDAEQAIARADEMLSKLGIAQYSDQLVEELSGGQRQRVAIARGLAKQASVLCADEITSDLDSDNRDIAVDLVRQEADKGAAVVFATHDSKVAAVCDVELQLKDGRAQFVRDNRE